MNLNFEPNNITNPKERFNWITVKYILNILTIIKKYNPDDFKFVWLFDMLKYNILVLKKNIIFDNNMLLLETNNIMEIENNIIENIKKIPITIDDDEFLC